MDLTTLMFILLAVFIAWRLRGVLGRRTDEDRARYERNKSEQGPRADGPLTGPGSEKVVQLPRRAPAAESPMQTGADRFRENVEEVIRKFAGSNAALADELIAIHRSDPSFEPEGFLQGARHAYEMIVTAFAAGDRRTLGPLLAQDVLEGFERAIGEREGRGERIEQSFVGIDRLDLMDAETKGKTAHLTVKFVSQLISTTLDKAGNVLAGDPKRIDEVTDIWTFARDLASHDPNWKLVATESAH